MSNYRNDIVFENLKGKTLRKVSNLVVGKEEVVFECDDNTKYRMYYEQDCCASCTVEDICGDVSDLIGTEILLAEKVTSDENPEGVKRDYQDSFTWTFYKLSTIKGTVTIRWYGESNGYYSESVTFDRVDS